MNVLFLAHRVPYAPNRGDRIRSYHVLRHLQALGHAVHLIAFAHDREEASHGPDLRSLVVSYDIVLLPSLRNYLRATAALLGAVPLTHVLLDAPEIQERLETARRQFQPDVVYAFCSGMARFAFEAPLAGVPWVLDLVDVDSLKWSDLARSTRGPLRWVYAREARQLSRFEAAAAGAAARTLVVAGREAAALAQIAPGVRVDVVPLGVETARFSRPGDAGARQIDVVFAGVFGYQPNARAARWFIERCWPAVRASCPEATLTLAGADPPRWLERLARSAGNVTVTGRVPDILPYLWRASVAIAPLHNGRGTQSKVLEALAAGLPTVVTSLVADGLPNQVRAGCVIADTPVAFAQATLDLLTLAETDRLAMVTRAGVHEMDWTTELAPLEGILRDSCKQGELRRGARSTP